MNKNIVAIIGMVAVDLALVAQALVICPSCGREAKGAEAICSHCQKPLPVASAKPAPAAEPVVKKDPTAIVISPELADCAEKALKTYFREGRLCQEKNPALAFMYFQNAIAVLQMVPQERLKHEDGDAFLKARNHALNETLQGRRTCRRCKGTGNFLMDLRKGDPRAGIKQAEGIPCPDCKGKGTVPGVREITKVKADLARAQAEFDRIRTAARDVRVGRVMIPAEMDGLLTTRMRAKIMTAWSVPCGTCQGTMRQLCTVCKGDGWVKCAYANCKNGELAEVKKTETITSKRLNDSEIKKCPRCQGTGEVPCVKCEGSGSVPCQQCSGSGCAARCTKCSGAGLEACRTCKGAGLDRNGAPCSVCKGECVVLCSMCKGEGARSK